MKETEVENTLWERFTLGDQSAFASLYDQYSDVLYSFGLRYTSDNELIKDCIHDLFIDLHHYRGRLAKEVNVKFYLLKSLRRKLNTANRKASVFSFQGWNSDETLPISTFTFSIEHEMIMDENQRDILQALALEINQLPDRQREILYLKFNHDLDYEEIAAIMQISVPTCRTFIYRALKQLRGRLEIVYILFAMLS
ncbi:RNA polymerase sigma factor [Dyadobacter diqingensis]|uniref:RNA polymerase sigma factor n=1 Tax=Dyadobacter diqingensis TaxID=2938121 RepID=UPI0020C50ED2|nr:sigma-70 family RNA polymerase sigma factor [Dyadobacter diqingensis]